MTAKTQSFKFKRTIQAPPAEVYRAFTSSTALREWFCNAAQADPHKGGRLYLWWNGGHSVSGEFTAAEPGKKVAFTWGGPREPGTSRVLVSLAAKSGRRSPSGDGTAVTVTHAGVGSGKPWAKTLHGLQRGWEEGLENLQSVLETGMDLRFTRRPMLGITGGEEMNAEVAARLGSPVTEGLKLEGLVAGMGAQAAGLQKDDVIVSLGGRKVAGWNTLVTALQAFHGGDQVKVVFHRGREKKTVTMELSRRPIPDVPADPKELAEAVRKNYAELDAELAACFEGVSEAEAGHRPAPSEWSAKEAVAHLIVGERDNQRVIADAVSGDEPWYDGFGGNVQARLTAVLAVFPTVPALLDELKRDEAEVVAALAALPPEFVARKGSYWRNGSGLLQLSFHTRDHMDQIRAAIAAARQP